VLFQSLRERIKSLSKPRGHVVAEHTMPEKAAK